MLPEVKEVNGARVLCKHVSWVFCARDEVDRYFVIFDALVYVMIPNVNVFCPLFNQTLIVATSRCGHQIIAKFLEWGLNPHDLLTSI